MLYELSNDTLAVTFESLGAEMISLREQKSGQEYLWHGDKQYWGRRSPVLFPVVGRLRKDAYTFEEKEYPMKQHGFARDMEFECISENRDEIWFSLDATPVTREVYPFDFHLEIGYHLSKNTVRVMWRVANEEKERVMFFSIGGHPAFLCPLKEGEKQSEYSIWMDTPKEVLFSQADLNTGLMFHFKNQMNLSNGRRILSEGFFDQGAYILEDYQVHTVALVDPENTPYLSVHCLAPVVGLWSPEQKNAPFVCIEPWYGRCDRETFTGTLQEREWGNKLAPGEVFERYYEIKIHSQN